MHHALAAVVHAEVGEAELLDVLLKRHHLQARVRLLDEVLHGVERGAVRGGHVVVHGHERAVGAAHVAAGGAEALERLGRGHLVHHVAVDEQEHRAVLLLVHHVVPHDLVVHGLARGHDAGGRGARAGNHARGTDGLARDRLSAREGRHATTPAGAVAEDIMVARVRSTNVVSLPKRRCVGKMRHACVAHWRRGRGCARRAPRSSLFCGDG